MLLCHGFYNNEYKEAFILSIKGLKIAVDNIIICLLKEIHSNILLMKNKKPDQFVCIVPNKNPIDCVYNISTVVNCH